MLLSLDFCPKCSWPLDRRPPTRCSFTKWNRKWLCWLITWSWIFLLFETNQVIFEIEDRFCKKLSRQRIDWEDYVILWILVVQLVFCHFLRRQCRVHKQSEVSQTNSKVSSCSGWTQGSDWTVSSNWGFSTTAGLFSLAIRCICFCCWWNWGTPWCLEREKVTCSHGSAQTHSSPTFSPPCSQGL